MLAAVFLIAGLFAANTRGGWLALAVGGLVSLLLARRGGASPARASLLVVVAVFVGGWLVYASLSVATDALISILPSGGYLGSASLAPGRTYSLTGPDALLSSVGRLELYELAIRALSYSRMLWGMGYLGFFYLMEQAGQGIASYDGVSTTYFVHNDYLQTLLELGLPGAAGLLAITVLPLALAWRTLPATAGNRTSVAATSALAGAMASMAAQAAVDFPFYIPACLLMYGGALGLLEARLPLRSFRIATLAAPGKRLLTAIGTILAGWVLLLPLAAELAGKHAAREWRSGRAERAAYWLEVARRIEPRDWRYHWYAGQFWSASAALRRNRTAAERAREAFASGYTANPRDTRCLIGLIRVNRELNDLLAAPADTATLRAWAQHAVALAPNDAQARGELALVLGQGNR
jgi:hypothetical protein